MSTSVTSKIMRHRERHHLGFTFPWTLDILLGLDQLNPESR